MEKESAKKKAVDDGKLNVEKEAVETLLDSAMFAGTSEMDNYSIPEVEKLDVNLPKRIRVFLKGPDVYEQTWKPSPIKRELRTIEDAIKRNFEKSYKTGGVVELTGMDGLVSDPVYQTRGPIVYVAFLEHYVKRTAENLGRAIDKAEALKAIGELERKNTFYFDGRNPVHLDDMDLKGKEEFEKQYGVSKRKLLEEERLKKLKHEPERFAVSVGREMFGHKNLEKYRESDAGIIPIGEGYAFKRIMHGKGKHEIAGVERTLPEIFEGLHALDEEEFRGRFGESKKRVVESMGDKFYKKDVPDMYAAYVKDLEQIVKKTPESELKTSFSGERTYKELLGGAAPAELRRELAAGVEDYMTAIRGVSSLFMPEQYEAAKKAIDAQDSRFSPMTQYQKDVLAREKMIAGLESMKKKKMLKDPKGGEFMDAYIKANYGRR